MPSTQVKLDLLESRLRDELGGGGHVDDERLDVLEENIQLTEDFQDRFVYETRQEFERLKRENENLRATDQLLLQLLLNNAQQIEAFSQELTDNFHERIGGLVEEMDERFRSINQEGPSGINQETISSVEDLERRMTDFEKQFQEESQHVLGIANQADAKSAETALGFDDIQRSIQRIYEVLKILNFILPAKRKLQRLLLNWQDSWTIESNIKRSRSHWSLQVFESRKFVLIPRKVVEPMDGNPFHPNTVDEMIRDLQNLATLKLTGSQTGTRRGQWSTTEFQKDNANSLFLSCLLKLISQNKPYSPEPSRVEPNSTMIDTTLTMVKSETENSIFTINLQAQLQENFAGTFKLFFLEVSRLLVNNQGVCNSYFWDPLPYMDRAGPVEVLELPQMAFLCQAMSVFSNIIKGLDGETFKKEGVQLKMYGTLLTYMQKLHFISQAIERAAFDLSKQGVDVGITAEDFLRSSNSPIFERNYDVPVDLTGEFERIQGFRPVFFICRLVNYLSYCAGVIETPNGGFLESGEHVWKPTKDIAFDEYDKGNVASILVGMQRYFLKEIFLSDQFEVTFGAESGYPYLNVSESHIGNPVDPENVNLTSPSSPGNLSLFNTGIGRGQTSSRADKVRRHRPPSVSSLEPIREESRQEESEDIPEESRPEESQDIPEESSDSSSEEGSIFIGLEGSGYIPKKLSDSSSRRKSSSVDRSLFIRQPYSEEATSPDESEESLIDAGNLGEEPTTMSSFSEEATSRDESEESLSDSGDFDEPTTMSISSLTGKTKPSASGSSLYDTPKKSDEFFWEDLTAEQLNPQISFRDTPELSGQEIIEQGQKSELPRIRDNFLAVLNLEPPPFQSSYFGRKFDFSGSGVQYYPWDFHSLIEWSENSPRDLLIGIQEMIEQIWAFVINDKEKELKLRNEIWKMNRNAQIILQTTYLTPTPGDVVKNRYASLLLPIESNFLLQEGQNEDDGDVKIGRFVDDWRGLENTWCFIGQLLGFFKVFPDRMFSHEVPLQDDISNEWVYDKIVKIDEFNGRTNLYCDLMIHLFKADLFQVFLIPPEDYQETRFVQFLLRCILKARDLTNTFRPNNRVFKFLEGNEYVQSNFERIAGFKLIRTQQTEDPQGPLEEFLIEPNEARREDLLNGRRGLNRLAKNRSSVQVLLSNLLNLILDEFYKILGDVEFHLPQNALFTEGEFDYFFKEGEFYRLNPGEPFSQPDPKLSVASSEGGGFAPDGQFLENSIVVV